MKNKELIHGYYSRTTKRPNNTDLTLEYAKNSAGQWFYRLNKSGYTKDWQLLFSVIIEDKQKVYVVVDDNGIHERELTPVNKKTFLPQLID